MKRPVGLALEGRARPHVVEDIEAMAHQGRLSTVEPCAAGFQGPDGEVAMRRLADFLAASDLLSAPTFQCSAGRRFDLSQPDDIARMDALEIFIGEMKDAVSAFDSRTLVVYPSGGDVTDGERRRRISALKESLSGIEERIRRYGVRIALKLLPHPALGSTPGELLEIASDFGDDFGFCLDAGLLAGSQGRLAEAVSILGDRLYDIHMPGPLPAAGQRPFDGYGADWAEFSCALDMAGYHGPLTYAGTSGT